MKEIKFRGKREYDGKFVYGNYAKYGEVDRIIVNGASSCSSHPVILETVGQYTGLKDNNGEEIYEGDIVKLLADDEIAVIEYDSEDAAFIVRYRDIDCIITFSDIWGKEVEVISNIHDNPKILIGDDE